MVPMTIQQAEIAATIYAAWNNLLLEGETPTDDQIVHAARDDWHPQKLRIGRERFAKAIAWLREKDVVPLGRGRHVTPK
jgi:hypothetical protein